jgi:CDP-diacylglycerol--serine O-phosphatidyltransferase
MTACQGLEDSMTHSKYRFLLPNGITFLSLVCGTCSILLSAATTNAGEAQFNLWLAGVLILASYVLDLCDGAAARTFNAGTAFGLQLDSLVDMVSLGLAPAVLLFMYLLRVEGLDPILVGWFVALVPLAGAFRLARFNLLPPKTTGNTASMGLTISTGGTMLTLAVLSDLAGLSDTASAYLYLPLIVCVSVFMASTIAFPSLYEVFSGWRKNVVLLALTGISLVFLSFFTACLFWLSAYVGYALLRAGYHRLK